VVLNPWNLDALIEVEKETGRKVFVVHQLRYHPEIIKLREKVLNGPQDKVYNVELTYIPPRGKWYQYSWKGDIQKSGGITTNIGIHFFDILLWIFGDVKENTVYQHEVDMASGKLKLANAEVNWMMSIDGNQVPEEVKRTGNRTYRSLIIDGEKIEFSDGFAELHTKAYENILAENTIELWKTKDVIHLLHDIRDADR
jgi:UDP-N-acetyl-2-amino-2-deoxyglucuronate dehydrogenase